VTNDRGLAIHTGVDLRPEGEKRPDWCKNAEKPVAKAIREEVKHAKLFARVAIHEDDANPKKYSEIVQFRIRKFECYDQAGFLEAAGREVLRYQGVRGALIAASIPANYIAEVEIEFEILDATRKQSVFVKSYSANRTITLNGYQSSKPKVQATSEALESVVTQFLGDLAQIQLSQRTP
jgi:hypothetical protein